MWHLMRLLAPQLHQLSVVQRCISNPFLPCLLSVGCLLPPPLPHTYVCTLLFRHIPIPQLCSGFAGMPSYADTYTTEEDPSLWRGQVGVKELVLDGGVLLGGFLNEPKMLQALSRELSLDRLVFRRTPDLTVEHLATAVGGNIAKEVVVVADCGPVSEIEVVAAGQRAPEGVRVLMAEPLPGEYEDASLRNSIEDWMSSL